ncbi:hypothetical protein PQQ59_06120 [Paraburkholderia aspalathi]|uniref:hypothetical protein n=1 Tax=Paraburkholderia aspalathi TaxID=1324617 RepID=UPI0038B7B734
MTTVKNIGHPNMFPGAAAAEAPDADIDGVAATPSPTSAWANPLAKLRPTAMPDGETKHATRADEAMAYLRIHGPSPAADLCKAMGITSKGGITPFINAALRDGRIVRNNGKYSIGGEPAAQPKAPPVAVSHFEAASTIVAARKKAKPVAAQPEPEPVAPAAPANLPVPASEAAAAIAAMRQPIEAEPKGQLKECEPPPLPAPVPVSTATPTGRKPDFVVFVGDVQLLSWPDGDITIQTESSTVELKHHHFRALITLVELRK